jgi:hypothetical protein
MTQIETEVFPLVYFTHAELKEKEDIKVKNFFLDISKKKYKFNGRKFRFLIIFSRLISKSANQMI